MKNFKINISNHANEWLSLLRKVEIGYENPQVLINTFNLLSKKDKNFLRTYQDKMLNSTIVLENISIDKQELLKILIDLNFDIDTPNIQGLSPLYKAIKYQLNEIIPILINKVIDVNQARIDNNGRKFGSSALMIACEQGNLEAVKLLIEKGADINYQNEFKFIPIIYAIDKNDDKKLACFSYLVSCENINLKLLNRFHEDISVNILKYGSQEYLEILSDNHIFLIGENKDIEKRYFSETNTTNNIQTQKELFMYYLKREQMHKLDQELSKKENKKTFKI